MRKLAFVVAAIGALAVAAPAFAADNNNAAAAQTQQAPGAQQTSGKQATDFSSHGRRYHGRGHWRGHRGWHGHRHWYGHRHYWRGGGYGWHRCRTVWRPYAGWVRVCRW